MYRMIILIISLIIVLLITVVYVIYNQKKPVSVPVVIETPIPTPPKPIDVPVVETPTIPAITAEEILAKPYPVIKSTVPQSLHPEPDPPTCDDPELFYKFYNPDIVGSGYNHWMEFGYKEGRKSCWNSIDKPQFSPTEAVCDGNLTHEAKFYYNNYPNLWLNAYKLPTEEERNQYALNNWKTIGSASNFTSCWPKVVIPNTLQTNKLCELNWDKPLIELPSNATGTIKVTLSRYLRNMTNICGQSGPICGNVDVTSKVAALCNGKKVCRLPSKPSTYFASNICPGLYKNIETQYKIV